MADVTPVRIPVELDKAQAAKRLAELKDLGTEVFGQLERAMVATTTAAQRHEAVLKQLTTTYGQLISRLSVSRDVLQSVTKAETEASAVASEHQKNVRQVGRVLEAQATSATKVQEGLEALVKAQQEAASAGEGVQNAFSQTAASLKTLGEAGGTSTKVFQSIAQAQSKAAARAQEQEKAAVEVGKALKAVAVATQAAQAATEQEAEASRKTAEAQKEEARQAALLESLKLKSASATERMTIELERFRRGATDTTKATQQWKDAETALVKKIEEAEAATKARQEQSNKSTLEIQAASDAVSKLAAVMEEAQKAKPLQVTDDEVVKRLAEVKAKGVETLHLLARAQFEAAVAGEEHSAKVKILEKALMKGGEASFRTAIELAKIQSIHVHGTEAVKVRAAAEERLNKVLADQVKRETANKGRSLSMLFDEMRNSLMSLPGPLGTVTETIVRAREESKKLASSGESGFASIAMMATPIGLATTAMLGWAAVLYKTAKATAQTADELGDLAAQSGMLGEVLSSYRVAVEMSETSIESLGKGFARLATLAEQSAQGNEKAAKVFRTLGMQVTDTQGRLKPVEVLFSEMADKIKGNTNATERLGMVVKVFEGELGRELLPLLSEGAKGIEELRQRNAELGLTMSAETMEAGAKWDEQIKELNLQMKGLSETIGRDAVGALVTYQGWINTAVNSWDKWLGVQRQAPQVQEEVSEGMVRLKNSVAQVEAELFYLQDNAEAWGGVTEEILDQVDALEQRRYQLQNQIEAQKELEGLQKGERQESANNRFRDTLAETEALAEAQKKADKEKEAAEKKASAARETAVEKAKKAASELEAIERRLLEAKESRIEKSIRLEEELVANVMRLGRASKTSETQLQADVAEVHRQAAAEREVITAEEQKRAAEEHDKLASQLEAIERRLLTARETRIEASLRLEAEAVAEVRRLGEQLGTDEEQLQASITQIQQQATQERMDLIAEEKRAFSAAERAKRQTAAASRDAYIQLGQQAGDAAIAVGEALVAHGKISAKEQYRINQAAAIAQSVLNAALAVSAVFAAEPGELVIKGIAAGIAATVAAAQIAAVVAAPPPKFEAGGVVRGARHSTGGVPVELEGGEVVSSRRDARKWGGPERLNEQIKAGPQQGSIMVVQTYRGRVMARAVLDQARYNRDFKQQIRTMPIGIRSV